MNLRSLRTLLIAGAALLQAGAAHAEPRAEDRQLLDRVSRRLLATVEAPERYTWPPVFAVTEASGPNRVGAHASAETEGAGDKPVPHVEITAALMEQVVQGSEDRLAYVAGHELAHVLLGHVLARPFDDDSPFLSTSRGREQELAADRRGMELAVAAGYSREQAIQAIPRMMEVEEDYSAFEGLRFDHPSWADRLAALDPARADRWRALGAFASGVFFLEAEDYAAAEASFRAVLRAKPDCPEAWTNLGYALLMRYADTLPAAEVRRLGLDQLRSAFFAQAPSLAGRLLREEGPATGDPMLGKAAPAAPAADLPAGAALWTDADAALRQALAVKPDLPLASAALAYACMLRPAGAPATETCTMPPTPPARAARRERATAPFRVVTAIQLPDGRRVTLAEPLRDVEARLGGGDAEPAPRGSQLIHQRYSRYGISLLAREQVLAIALRGPDAPAVSLRAPGPAGAAVTLRVGLSRAELEQTLGDADYDFIQLEDPDVNYRYYRDFGLAARIVGGQVTELVIVQAPERRPTIGW
jgi:tetratricopeptide (TPR) repeat protein